MKQQISSAALLRASSLWEVVLTYVFTIGIITALFYYFSPLSSTLQVEKTVESFTPSQTCAALKDCSTCTTLDGCAWCAGTETCRALADGCPGAAEEVILQKNQCQSSAQLAGAVSGRDVPATSDVVNRRRLALVKKYVDRIVFNYEKLDVEKKNIAKTYIQENLNKLT
jgi:hypothetical protein